MQDATEFEGFASRPGARVDIYVLDRRANSWVFQRSATASTGPLMFGGEALYHWRTSVRLADDGNWPCYLQDDCAFGDGLVRYQVREPGGRLPVLYTFGPGGLDCTINGVLSGKTLVEAYVPCMPDHDPNEVHVYYWPFL